METQEIWFKSYSHHLFLHGQVLNAQNLCALPSILSHGDTDTLVFWLSWFLINSILASLISYMYL